MELDEQILCISFFDQKIGPSKFYCSSEFKDNLDAPDLNKILEFNDVEGSFIFAFRNYQTVNHIFFIKSQYARGGEELFMISYVIKSVYFRNETADLFKYLEIKKTILQDFASKLKELKNFPRILHENLGKSIRHNILDLVSEEFKESFLNLFNRYLNKLNIHSKVINLHHSQNSIKKIFIFGDRGAGKTTFLRNIETIQFHNQNNIDLPTMIYEIILDNLKIFTYDSIPITSYLL